MTTVLVHLDQLTRDHGALAGVAPGEVRVLMVRNLSMLRSRPWHVQKLHLLLTAAEHFAADLRAEGFEVALVDAPTLQVALAEHRRRHGAAEPIRSARPSSHAQVALLERLGVVQVDHTMFLTSAAEFTAWADGVRTLRMEPFYRRQRLRLGILVEGGQPVGGTWNLDAENRLPPPRSRYQWPTVLTDPLDEVDARVADWISRAGLTTWGEPPDGTWARTRTGARARLAHFIAEVLPGFGPYEDAMPADSWSVHHSLLSPYLNLGLLHPREVVDAALQRHAEQPVPLSSLEGFIRQIIGWREYVHGAYWWLGPEYRHRNDLGARAPLPLLFTDPSRTDMACMASVIGDVRERGWAHHIPRLMLMANLALIAGVDPAALLGWMRAAFIDAYDWVMVPNVIGMGVHADSATMMTKPYAAGGAYIDRMGRWCRGCRYNPRLRSGDEACPFTTLYWDFLDRNAEALAGNHRMTRQVSARTRLADLPAVRTRAPAVVAGLVDGRV